MTDNTNRDKLPFLYEEVFQKNPAGLVILDDLYTRFYDKEHKTPLSELDLAFDAGQRAVIRFIMRMRDRPERERATQGEMNG